MENSAEIITKTIRNRRSIFPPSYIEKDIPKEIINTILENANYAPTHKLTEPWRFIVFKGESLNKLGGFSLKDTGRLLRLSPFHKRDTTLQVKKF